MIKTIDDYMDSFIEKFPWVKKTLLKKIIKRGFYKFDYVVRRGAAFQARSGRGHLIIRQDCRHLKGFFKAGVKGRLFRKEFKWIFTGRYYVGLTESEFKRCTVRNTKGEVTKIKPVILKHQFITISFKQILALPNKKYFFCYYFPVNVGEHWCKDEIDMRDCRYIGYKDEKNNIIII